MINQFKAEVFQNQFLPEGSTEVHAIMTVSSGSEVSDVVSISPTSGGRLFGIICDTSGSMGGEKIFAAKEAMSKIVNLLPADAHFFIVKGAGKASVVFPVSPANPTKKVEAIAAI